MIRNWSTQASAWVRARIRREGEDSHGQLTWDTMLLFMGNGLVSFLFLLFHVLAGRGLSGDAYAELVAMIGVLNVLGVPATVMQLTMARYIAQLGWQDEARTWRLMVRLGIRGVCRWGSVGLLVWLLLSPWLNALFNASSLASIWMAGVTAFVFLFTPILSGALQGRHRFGWFVLSGLGVASSRLIFTLVLLLIAPTVPVMLAVVAASYAIGLGVSGVGLRESNAIAATNEPDRLPASREIRQYFWGVLAGQAALFLLIQADVILAPRLLEGASLAAYSKAATLSRIVFFLPLPIITAMFPRAVVSKRPGVIVMPLLATLAAAVGAALFLSVFPGVMMRLIYGVDDALHVALVRRYVWSAIPLALISILSPYLWARREILLTLGLIPLVAIYLGVILVWPMDPARLIGCMAAAGGCALLLLLGRTLCLHRRSPGAP